MEESSNLQYRSNWFTSGNLPKKVIENKGSKNVFLKTKGQTKENDTGFLLARADGHRCTPMIVFMGHAYHRMGPRHGGGDFLGETHAELVVACSLAPMFVAHQPAFQQEKLLMVKILLCKHKDSQGDLQ